MMANSYFQFKQFTVNQEKSAMKVCTDACVFGAYISAKEKDFTNDETDILDIGTGTGLLSMMIAQKVEGNIDAVEIDENAYEQARENFKNSPWEKRLTALHADIKQLEVKKTYDIIISNPPFFEASLKSTNNLKSIAKHTTTLPFTSLASIVSVNLRDKGRFYILLPFSEFKTFEKIAARNKLWLRQAMNITQQRHSSNYFRTIGVFTNTGVETENTESLTISDESKQYSHSFRELLKDYYLYL